jgi:hypothetical protein
MSGPEMVPLDFVMLPKVLHDMGWSTHAIGKWNLGNLVKDFTPTYRGFDTFLGYYAAALKDYWFHGGGGHCQKSNCSAPGDSLSCSSPTDLSNSSGTSVRPADAPGVNGTYDEVVFTSEALRLIRASDAAHGFYLYLAYQNVRTSRRRGTRERSVFVLLWGLLVPGAPDCRAGAGALNCPEHSQWSDGHPSDTSSLLCRRFALPKDRKGHVQSARWNAHDPRLWRWQRDCGPACDWQTVALGLRGR